MARLLDPQNKFFSMVGKLGDHLLLGLLWLLCSLPVVTVGAASTAVARASMMTLGRGECRPVRDFFAAFRAEFKLSTLLWLLYLAVAAVLAWDAVFYYGLAGGEDALPAMLVGFFAVLAVVYLTSLLWVFPYVARYRCKFLQAVKMSFLLGVTHLGATFIMLLTRAALVAATLYVQFLLPFLPGLVAFVDGLCLRRAFGRYTGEDRKEDDGE